MIVKSLNSTISTPGEDIVLTSRQHEFRRINEAVASLTPRSFAIVRAVSVIANICI
jgi:hypothetical protein